MIQGRVDVISATYQPRPTVFYHSIRTKAHLTHRNTSLQKTESKQGSNNFCVGKVQFSCNTTG